MSPYLAPYPAPPPLRQTPNMHARRPIPCEVLQVPREPGRARRPGEARVNKK